MPVLGRSFWLLVIGVCSIIAVTMGLFVLALFHNNAQRQSQQQSQITADKIEHALSMREAVRKRSFSLATVQTMDDYFDRDSEFQHFNDHAHEFVVARDKLFALNASTAEQEILDRFQFLVRGGRGTVEKAMRTLVDDPTAASAQSLLRKAVVFHARALEELTALVDHLGALGQAQRLKAQRDDARDDSIFFALGSTSVLLVLLIAANVIIRERHYNKAIAKEIAERVEAEAHVSSLNTSLEQRVEERTAALKSAKSEADFLRHRLIDALESIPDGFTVTGPDGRLELFNNEVRKLYPLTAEHMKVGMPFPALARAFAESGEFPEALDDIEGWISRRIESHNKGNLTTVQTLNSGRRIRVVERRMHDGGIVSVRTDISEMLQAKDDAEAANRAKTDFLSSMSHELRTPLNAIIGFSQLLLDDTTHPLPAIQNEEVTHIYESGEQLLLLIEDVLDFAKIDSGKMTIAISDSSILSVLSECQVMLRSMAKKYKVSIIVDERSFEGTFVRADSHRLRQVLVNLITNAVKYNRPHGEVSVYGRDTKDGKFRIHVSDSGDGISETQAADLFKPFSRLGFESSTIEGTGIGLTLTKNLVEMMEGDIGFESKPDEGSVFWVSLALSAPASAQNDDGAVVLRNGYGD